MSDVVDVEENHEAANMGGIAQYDGLSISDVQIGPFVFVRRDTPAAAVFRRFDGKIHPGSVLFVSNEEMQSLNDDVIWRT